SSPIEFTPEDCGITVTRRRCARWSSTKSSRRAPTSRTKSLPKPFGSLAAKVSYLLQRQPMPCGRSLRSRPLPKRQVRNGPSCSGFRATATKARTGWSVSRSEEHTSELQSRFDLVCRLLLEKKKKKQNNKNNKILNHHCTPTPISVIEITLQEIHIDAINTRTASWMTIDNHVDTNISMTTLF